MKLLTDTPPMWIGSVIYGSILKQLVTDASVVAILPSVPNNSESGSSEVVCPQKGNRNPNNSE